MIAFNSKYNRKMKNYQKNWQFHIIKIIKMRCSQLLNLKELSFLITKHKIGYIQLNLV